MKTFSSPKKGQGKPGSKLSLQKRGKANKGETKEKVKSVVSASLVDLNETCEFKDGKSLAGPSGRSLAGSKRHTSTSDLEKEMCLSEEPDLQPSDDITCQVCQKNLSHMNTQRQQQHVNRCIDKLEEKEEREKAEKQALETAKTAVLSCPMCGQTLNTEQARVSHLKKCSQQLGVTTEMMLKLVKEQEEERQLSVSAGVIPSSVKSIKSADGNKQKKKKAVKEPKSKFDEDVQIAMAISSSLADQGIMAGHDLIGQSDIPSNTDRDRKKSRKKKNVEEICQLTELTDADRQRRLADKVNTLLAEERADTMDSPGELFQTNLSNHTGSVSLTLWSKAGTCSEVEVDRAAFYVGALVPPVQVSGVQTGTRFKRLSSIPGREKSFVKENLPDKSEKAIVQDDIFTASTQTAIVLAELAVDSHNEEVVSQSPIDLNATGFLVDEEMLRLDPEYKDKEKEKLCMSFKSMINNPRYSDVQLVTADGHKLYGHKNILAVRCPQLIQENTDAEIKLDLSTKGGLAFLSYLYTGDLNITVSCQSELITYSEKLGLKEFKVLCENAKSVTDDNGAEADDKVDTRNADDEEDLNETRLDVVLKEIWGESDTDSDDNEVSDSKKGDELSEQDYRDIRSSQRQKLQTREENDTVTTDSSDDSDIAEAEGHDKHICKSDTVYIKACDNDAYKLDKILSTDKSVKKHVSSKNDNPYIINADVQINNDSNVQEALSFSRTKIDVNKMSDTGVKSSTSSKGNSTDMHICEKENNDISTNNTMNEVGSPAQKRMRLRFDYNNECNKNDDYKLTREKMDVNEDLKNHSARYSGEFLAKKDCKKSQEVAYCGLSFDSSFTSSKDASTSKLDSSGTDLFGSPSPKKIPLFKLSQKEITTGNNSLFSKVDIAKAYEKNNSSVNVDNPVTEENDIFPDGSSASDDDVEITGDNFMEISQSSPKFGDKNIKNIPCLKEISRHFDSNGDHEMFTSKTQTEPLSPDDVEITGDNFMEISQNSKIGDKENDAGSFSENVSGNDNEYCTDMERATSKTVSDHLGTMPSHSQRAVSVSLENDLTNEMEDLENYNFNDSFNESCVNDVHLDAKNTSNCSGSMDKIDNVCDKDRLEKISDNRLKTTENLDTVKDIRNISDNVVVEVDSDSSGQSQETGDMGNTDICSNLELECFRTETEAAPTVKVGSTRSSVNAAADELSSTVINDDSSRDATEAHAVEEQEDANVWDDFEDCGYSDIITSQALQQIGKETADYNKDDDDDHDDVSVLDTAALDGDDDVKVIETDRAARKEKHTVAKLKKSTFKTPSVGESRPAKKRAWEPPSPFTPIPNYDTMATPMLKKQVQKFGVKPVGKKRMVKVLKDIYHQTHQYETDSEFEDDTADKQISKPISMETAIVSEAGDGPSSQTDISSSQESDVSDLLEETCIHPPSDESDVSGSPQKGVDLTKQLTDYISRNKQLKIRMLMYEPIELDVFKKDLKEAGIKCNMDRVMEFLDERCIAFTTKNTRKQRATKTQARKKSSKPATKS